MSHVLHYNTCSAHDDTQTAILFDRENLKCSIDFIIELEYEIPDTELCIYICYKLFKFLEALDFHKTS